jgi:hypothetical protein
MATKKRLALALVLVLLAGTFGSSQAQSTPTTKTQTVNAVEIFPGILDSEQDIKFAVTFLGTTSGDLGGFITAAVNFTPSEVGAGLTNIIVGGNWAIAVYRNGRFQGTLFGQVTGGTVVWDDTGDTAAVSATVNIKGGTGNFRRVTGTGTFEGTLDHTPLANRRPPKLTGTLQLTF